MFSNYIQNHTGKIAQTYLLASKVKSKLTKEAVKHDVDLHKLVCQANLLDTLIENLNIYESSNNNNSIPSPVSYDSIYSSPYPLLNNMINDSNDYDDDDNNKNYNNNDNNNKLNDINTNPININNTNTETYYTSDDSDFDSDNDNDSDNDSDEDNGDYYFNQQNSNITFTDNECSSDVCCLALQRLNIKSEINNDSDEFDLHDNIYDAEFSIHHTTISFSDSESESDEEYDNIKPSCYYENENCLMRMQSRHNTVIGSTDTPDTMSTTNISTKTGSEDDDFPSLSSCSSVSSDESCQIEHPVKIQSILNDIRKTGDLYSTNNNQSEENLYVL